MPQRIEFEGQVHEFPDDFSPEEISAALAQAAPAAPAPAPIPAGATPAPPLAGAAPDGGNLNWYDEGYGEAITPREAPSTDPLRGLKLGTQAVGRGVGELAGAPVDLATMVTNLILAGAEAMPNMFLADEDEISLPRATNPVGGSGQIIDAASQAAESAGMDLIERPEMTTGERIAYDTNRLATEGLLGGGMFSRLKGAASLPYREALSNAAKAKTAPGAALEASKPFIVDTAAGAGAGATVSAGQEILPEQAQGPVTDLILALVGGLTGARATQATIAPRAATEAIRQRTADPRIAPDPETGAPVQKRTSQKVGKFLQDQALDSEGAAGTVRREAEQFRREGSPVPTTGILSNDEGLMAVERKVRQSAPQRFSRQDRFVESAASEDVRALGPEGADPRTAQRFVEQDVAARKGAAQQQVETAKGRATGAEQVERDLGDVAAAARGGREEASRALDETVVDKTMKPRVTEKNQRFEGIDPEGKVQRDITPLREAVDKIEADATDLLPSARKRVVPQELIDDIKAVEDGTISFRALNRHRPILTESIAEARRAGQWDLADNLKALRDQIGEEAERLAKEGGEAGTRAQDAIEYYRTEFAPYFARGAGGKLRKDINADDATRSNTPPTDTARRFLHVGKGSAENAKDLAEILKIAPSPAEGQEAVRQYLLDSLASTVGTDKKISPVLLREWVNQRKGMLDQFPEFKGEVAELQQAVLRGRERTATLQKEVDRSVAELERTERDIQDSAVSLMLDTDPVVAVGRVFKSKDPERAMRDIVAKVKEDKSGVALQGWKKAVADHLEQTLTTTNLSRTADDTLPVSPAKLNRLFQQNEKVLATLYSPAEMNTLRRAQRLVNVLQRRSVTATMGSPTAENQQLWNSLEAVLLGVTGNAITTGMVMKRIKTVLKLLPGNERDAVDRLVTRAMFDPELAAHLLTTDIRKVNVPAWNKKLTRLLGLSEAAREDLEPDAE